MLLYLFAGMVYSGTLVTTTDTQFEVSPEQPCLLVALTTTCKSFTQGTSRFEVSPVQLYLLVALTATALM